FASRRLASRMIRANHRYFWAVIPDVYNPYFGRRQEAITNTENIKVFEIINACLSETLRDGENPLGDLYQMS
ncbi:hypothetical protein L9F63_000026, partial [Diploptera punctata]